MNAIQRSLAVASEDPIVFQVIVSNDQRPVFVPKFQIPILNQGKCVDFEFAGNRCRWRKFLVVNSDRQAYKEREIVTQKTAELVRPFKEFLCQLHA